MDSLDYQASPPLSPAGIGNQYLFENVHENSAAIHQKEAAHLIKMAGFLRGQPDRGRGRVPPLNTPSIFIKPAPLTKPLKKSVRRNYIF
jgi:hypothetical protein